MELVEVLTQDQREATHFGMGVQGTLFIMFIIIALISGEWGYALGTIPSLFFVITYFVKITNDDNNNKVNKAIIANTSKKTD